MKRWIYKKKDGVSRLFSWVGDERNGYGERFVGAALAAARCAVIWLRAGDRKGRPYGWFIEFCPFIVRAVEDAGPYGGLMHLLRLAGGGVWSPRPTVRYGETFRRAA